MSQEFHKTVNLREKNINNTENSSVKNRTFEKRKSLARKPSVVGSDKQEDSLAYLSKSSSDNEGEREKIRKELTCIKRPEQNNKEDLFYKKLFFASLFLLILLFAFWFLFFHSGADLAQKKDKTKEQDFRWYVVKLVNGEVFYGEINNISADPVLIKEVYYNYDQVVEGGDGKEGVKKNTETGKLKIVKRGNEAYGPDGTMNVVRSQILYMEPLRQDSEVIRAILNNEK